VGGTCVITDGKFQPSGISGEVTGKGHALVVLDAIGGRAYAHDSSSTHHAS